jgi:hypothetical protein
MKTIEQLSAELAKSLKIPQNTVAFHLKRIARKFDYELYGKDGNLMDDKDAKDVEFITYRFLLDRVNKEKSKKTHTRLLPMIVVNKESPDGAKRTPKTKQMPIIKP